MARRAVLVKVCLAGLGIAHQNIQLAGSAAVGKRLVVQKGRNGSNVAGAQIKFRHSFAGNAVADDRRDEVSVLIVKHNLRQNQIGSRFSASCVCAVAKAAVGFKQLLPMRKLRGRSGRALRVGRSPMRALGLGRGRCVRRSLAGRLLAKCDDTNCQNESYESSIKNMFAQIRCPQTFLIGTCFVRRA